MLIQEFEIASIWNEKSIHLSIIIMKLHKKSWFPSPLICLRDEHSNDDTTLYWAILMNLMESFLIGIHTTSSYIYFNSQTKPIFFHIATVLLTQSNFIDYILVIYDCKALFFMWTVLFVECFFIHIKKNTIFIKNILLQCGFSI